MTATPDADDGPAPVDHAMAPGPSKVEDVCEGACALALVAMIGLIGAEALARNILHTSLQMADEVGGYLLVAVSFLSLSVAEAHGAYHRVELVQARLSRRARLLSSIGFDLLSLAACLVLTWQLTRLVMNSWQTEDVAPTPLLTPLWLPQITMPIGIALLCYSLVRTIVAKLRRMSEATA